MVTIGQIGNRMYYSISNILLDRQDESCSGQRESVLLSLINIDSFCHGPCFIWLTVPTDHLAKIALGVSIKSKSLQLSPVCLFMCAQSICTRWDFFIVNNIYLYVYAYICW